MAKSPKAAGFVNEADGQSHGPGKSYGHLTVAIGSAAHKGSANENFYRHYGSAAGVFQQPSVHRCSAATGL